MAKVLVVGGAGFIGTYICRELLELGHTPVIFDAFINYISPLSSAYQRYLQYRFEDIEDKIEILRGDARNKDQIRRAIMKHKPSHIIHMAALPIADLSNESSEEAIDSIVSSATNVLEVIRDVDFVERFVFASSSMIYGDFEYTPCDEEHPKRPKEVYGGTKYAGEIIVQAFARRFGLKYSIVRPSAVYGPTDVNRRVSQIFVENAFLGKPIHLHGDGSTPLDFTYIKDIAHGFVLATFHENAENETFNITTGEGKTLKDFAEELQKYFPDLEIAYKPIDVFRPKRGSLSIEKARKLIGYEPQYNLEKGVKEYVEFLKDKPIL
jgi:UDP-glucose 4-epimerase